ncbi:MAG TPA: hypothetical protein VFK50_04640 [Sphingomicrobium sp.]|nr:hypothetical protein [Sphingomicrobium sp.]
MILRKLSHRGGIAVAVTLATASVSALVASTPAHSKISLGLDAGALSDSICLMGTQVVTTSSPDTCSANVATPQFLQIGSATDYARFDAANGTATFTAPANFSDNVQMSGLQTFAGTSSFSSTVHFTGPAVNFSTQANFASPVTFNGTSNFTAGMTTTNITSSGTINSTNLNVTGSLTAAPGTTINLGGVNRIQGVAAGINDLDAVNVAQLMAATSGIATDITALETTSATHTTQIANLQTTSATHTTQIAAVQAVNATQSNQISAIEAVNTTQASQITAIQALNSSQTSQIGALQAAQDLVDSRVDALFDLRGTDRRDMKQGVASAMAMASAPMPSEPGRVAYAMNGATFRGEYAIGGSVAYRLPGARSFSVNAGFSFAGNRNNGARIGIAGEF